MSCSVTREGRVPGGGPFPRRASEGNLNPEVLDQPDSSQMGGIGPWQADESPRGQSGVGFRRGVGHCERPPAYSRAGP
jgi:hypothetical protein